MARPRSRSRSRSRSFGSFATACWNSIACCNSLPNEEQQQQRQQQQQLQLQQQQLQLQQQQLLQQQQEEENEENDQNDPQMWSNDLERHSCGEFSHAAVQSSTVMRSYSQVEVGSNGIFVGIYDGHNSHHAAEYLSMNLMNNLISNIRQHNTLTDQGLRNAIQATDEGFLNHVQSAQQTEPMLVVSGSCCVVGAIWKRAIFGANVGISIAVNGRQTWLDPVNGEVRPSIMSREHNVEDPTIRQLVMYEHRHDPNFVVLGDNGMWRIKGRTKIARSIGDAYLKRAEFIVPSSISRDFRLSTALIEPGLSSEPFIRSGQIDVFDKFYIFASHGFWDHVTRHRAVSIAANHPRQGIARKLLKVALKVAARKAHTTYNNIVGIPQGPRLNIHDDITVIVVFVDNALVGAKDPYLEERSFKGFTNDIGPSQFREIDELM